MARQTFLDTAEDMEWLREVHLPKLPREYKSAMLHGNEDYPDKIVVYKSRNPSVYDAYTIYEPDADGKYERTSSGRPVRL